METNSESNQSIVQQEVDKIASEELARIIREDHRIMADIREGVYQAVNEFDFSSSTKEGVRLSLLKILSNPDTFVGIKQNFDNKPTEFIHDRPTTLPPKPPTDPIAC